MRDDQVAAGQQCDGHGNAQDKLQRRPQHPHKLDKAQRSGDVPAIKPLKEADLRLLAGEGSDQACAGVVFLCLRGDLREAGLDALEAVVDSVAEVLHQDAGQRHRRQCHKCKPGAQVQQEIQSEDSEEDRVRAIHEGRAEQHSDGIKIVGQPGHDVAGAVALIEARVLPLQVEEQVVTQVKLDLSRDADETPALGVEKDALGQRYGHQQTCKAENRFAGSLVLLHLVDGPSQNSGKLDRCRIGGDAGEGAPQVSPAVAAHIWEEGGQIAEHISILRGGAG